MGEIDGNNLGAVIASKFSLMIEIIGGFLEKVNWGQAFTTLADTITSAFTTISSSVDKVDFEEIGTNLKNSIAEIKTDDLTSAALTVLNNALSAVKDLDIAGILSAIAVALRDAIYNVPWYAVGENIRTFLEEAIGDIKISNLISNLGKLLLTVFNSAIKLIGGLLKWDELDVPEIDVEGDIEPKTIGESIKKCLENAISGINTEDLIEKVETLLGDVFNGAIELLGGLLNWDDLKVSDMEESFSAISDSIASITECVTTTFLDRIKQFGGVFTELASSTVSNVLSLIKSVFEGLEPIITTIAPLIADIAVAFATMGAVAGNEIILVLKGFTDAIGNLAKFLTGKITWDEFLQEMSDDTEDTVNRFMNMMDTLGDKVNETFGITAESIAAAWRADIEGAESLEEYGEQVEGFLDQIKAHAATVGENSDYYYLLAQAIQVLIDTQGGYGESLGTVNEILSVIGVSLGDVTTETGCYTAILNAQGEEIGKISQNAVELYNSATGTAQALSNAEESVSEMGNSTEEAKDKVEDMVTAEGVQEDASEDMGKSVAETAKDFNEVAKAMSEYIKVTDEQREDMEKLTEDVKAANDAVSEFIDTNKTAKSEIKTAWQEIYTTMSTYIGNLKTIAYTWGADLTAQLAYGMTGSAWMVANAASFLASTISSYIHFSEPDVGALSNFHTFMPDMIEEMVSGIEDNEGSVGDAMAGLTSMMAEEAQSTDIGLDALHFDVTMDSFADKIVDGFENLIERMTAIAENVTFSVPSFAAGVVSPYGTASGSETTASDIVNAINALKDSVSATGNGDKTENLFNITLTLDGQELAAKITKIQRQQSMARGV